MITSFMAAGELHAIYEIRREGMTKIRAKGFCAVEDDAKLSVYQVPDWTFDGRPTYGEIPVCAKCMQAIFAMREPPQ